MKRLAWVCALWLPATGCNWSTATAADCQHVEGDYEATFTGAVRGSGVVSVAASRAGRHRVRLRMAPDGGKGRAGVATAPGAAMELVGTGLCEGGVLTGRLAPIDGARHGYKVLGGTLVSVLDPRHGDVPFGRFQAEVVKSATGTRATLSGFWHDPTQFGAPPELVARP